jgi:hypothetical protein
VVTVSFTNSGEHMDDQVFDLLMKRFDTLEAQNKTQLDLMQTHIEIDDKAHKILERHSAYFSVMSAGSIPILGWIAYKLGIKQ